MVMAIGTNLATAQIVSVLSIQFGVGLLLAVTLPGIDRFECFVTATQFLLEGAATACFLSRTESAAPIAFGLALCALFLPIALNLYDSIIVPVIIRLRTHEKLTWKVIFVTVLGVLFSIPATAMTLAGCTGCVCCADLTEEAVGRSSEVASEELVKAQSHSFVDMEESSRRSSKV